MSDAVGDLWLDTGSGSVTIDNLAVQRLAVDTGSGRVMLTVPADFGAELHIETGSGGIDTDIPVQVEGRQRRNELIGVAGDGRGTVRIDTGSGGVRILPAS